MCLSNCLVPYIPSSVLESQVPDENLGPQLCSHARPERKEAIGTKWPLATCQPHQLPYSLSTRSPSECFCPAKRPPATPPLLPDPAPDPDPTPTPTPTRPRPSALPPSLLWLGKRKVGTRLPQSTQTSHRRLISQIAMSFFSQCSLHLSNAPQHTPSTNEYVGEGLLHSLGSRNCGCLALRKR